MSIYEHDSLMRSISNLAMLKAFYDAGVDIAKIDINDFYVDVMYSTDSSMYILEDGCKMIFDKVNVLSYEDLEQHEDLFDDGFPEIAIFIRDNRLSKISNHLEELMKFINKKNKTAEYSEADIKIIKPGEIMVQIWFPGFLHEIAISLIAISNKLNELTATLKEETDEVSNNVDRQAA